MFDNIGGKIKVLAMVGCLIGTVASLILAGNILIDGLIGEKSDGLWVGFVILIAGPLLSWIGSFTLYGFGQLVENSDILVENQEENLQMQKTAAAQNVKKQPGKKWKCTQCGMEIVSDYNYCPYCAYTNKRDV